MLQCSNYQPKTAECNNLFSMLSYLGASTQKTPENRSTRPGLGGTRL
jgi:hypothetical protein